MQRCETVVGRIIRRARRQAGLTQHQLAEQIECSISQLSQMETGRRAVTESVARNLEEALGLESGRLVRAAAWQRAPESVRREMKQSRAHARSLTTHLRQAITSDDPLAHLRTLIEQHGSNIETPQPIARQVPVINNVAAGMPTEFTDLDYPASVADEYIACPDMADPDAFAARVIGDSMQPDYREGEVVVFSPELPTPDGADCFVRLERDNETTFKRVFFEEGGGVIRLQPLNEAYAPRRVPREQIAGMYAAAYVLRRVGTMLTNNVSG